eukprot:SAG31_NODE_810_length_11919_cov_4.480924_13_plen_78_part_00
MVTNFISRDERHLVNVLITSLLDLNFGENYSIKKRYNRPPPRLTLPHAAAMPMWRAFEKAAARAARTSCCSSRCSCC